MPKHTRVFEAVHFVDEGSMAQLCDRNRRVRNLEFQRVWPRLESHR